MAYLNDPIGQAGQRWSAQAPLSTDALAAQRERMARYGMPLQDAGSSLSYPGATGAGGPSGQYNPYNSQSVPDFNKMYDSGSSQPRSGGTSTDESNDPLMKALGGAQKAIWGGMLQIPGAINWLGQKLS